MNLPWRKIAFAMGGGLAGLASAHLLTKRPASLAGMTVLITGGSRGLGLALAREFGRQGCRLAICARTPDQLARAEQRLRSDGFETAAFVCDITDPTQTEAMLAAVRERFGAIDILVNNAGQILVGPVQNMTEADFHAAMDAMFWGPLRLILAVVPEMRERGIGRIVNISSIGGKIAIPHLLPYCCAKFALMGLSQGLRSELAGDGIQVTTVAPWLMRTGGERNAIFKGQAAAESAWFSLSAGSPLTSQTAEHAARTIVRGVRHGRSELVLSPQGEIFTALAGAMPALLPGVFALVNRMILPAPGPDSTNREKGLDLIRLHGAAMKFLTASGRDHGTKLNQQPL